LKGEHEQTLEKDSAMVCQDSLLEGLCDERASGPILGKAHGKGLMKGDMIVCCSVSHLAFKVIKSVAVYTEMDTVMYRMLR
jgi:hypothetical protein